MGGVLQADRHLDRWQNTLNQLYRSPRFQRFLVDRIDTPEGRETRVKEALAIELGFLGYSMRGYAESWRRTIDKHVEAGVYRRVLEFGRLDADNELLVDICCGCAGFLAERGKQHAIGIDINPYALEFGAQLLASRGMDAKLFAETDIYVNPERGIVLEPIPVFEEIDLRKLTLLCDDLDNLHNLMRALYMQGRLADSAVFMLQGGKEVARKVEFIADAQPEEAPNPLGMIPTVLKNARKFCRVGGRLIIGIRVLNIENETIEFPDLGVALHSSTKEIDACAEENRYEIRKKEKTTLPREDGENGSISLSLVGVGGTEPLMRKEVEEEIKRRVGAAMLLYELVIK
ncbi:Uncharacterised protein [Candidatus Bilamarchaeum dharawalense]|uniref:Methyltransferase domain-containing protein n=1 Tax=Candidatus Bilamarchaeum dharawalense TaxID=2885759 RepID=A0A5E4LTV1_9ARCH|nr:Uncharacterised protein [Candidatus Bilamarchaeum dharawalense]